MRKVKKDLLNTVTHLNTVIKNLVEFIEDVCNYNPVSREYQAKWLKLIDEELESGNTDAAFWKKKYRKF